MTVYIVTVDFEFSNYWPEHVGPLFDSVHKTKEEADKRRSEIMQGINLSGTIESAFGQYQWELEHAKCGSYNSPFNFYFFESEVVPVEL